MRKDDNNGIKMIWEEGQWYPFRLHAEIVLPDGEKQYLLEDSSGTKHLLSYEHYKDYGFLKGREVRLRLDKINCSGKLFLEPEHPVYKEGDSYDFFFIRTEERENIFGETELVWLVLDAFNHEIAIPMTIDAPEAKEGEPIRCRVSRIKKGKIYLSHPMSKTSEGVLKEGHWLSFYLEPDQVEIDGIRYYILSDPGNQKHLLKKLPFLPYGFEAGQSIVCKVVKWSNKGMYILEPEHPLYREGLDYTFEIVGLTENNFSVKDVFGNIIEIEKQNNPPIVIGERIALKVFEIRKGRPVLFLS